MKLLIQRVNSANVNVNSEIVGEINKGIVVFLGISKEDTYEKLEWGANKLSKIRLWESNEKGFDLNINDINGEVLIVSQFTLEGDLSKGNKPNFAPAAEYEMAKNYYEKFIELCKSNNLSVSTGIFGADMKVNLENDGPVTLIVEK